MAMFSADLGVFLMFCFSPLLVSATGVSTYTHDFMALYNGDFDNQKQIDEPGNQNAFIQGRLIPVDAPGLGPGPVIYVEWATNETVLGMSVLLVSEHPGPSIHLDIYNFTDDRSYKPGEFNVSTLNDFTLKDLRGGNCTAVYKRLTKSVYVGYYPECSDSIQGSDRDQCSFSLSKNITKTFLTKRLKINVGKCRAVQNNPNYADTFTCNAYSVIFPPTGPFFTTTPYILNRVGDRHPLIGFPDNFDNICGRGDYPQTTPSSEN